MKGLESRVEDLEQLRPHRILGPLVVRLMPGDPDYVPIEGEKGPIIIDCRHVIPREVKHDTKKEPIP